jgi:hypothetical protein
VILASLRWAASRLAAQLIGGYGADQRRKVHARLIQATNRQLVSIR